MSEKNVPQTAWIQLEFRCFCPNCKKNFSAKESDHNKETFCPGCDQVLLQKVRGKD